MMKLKTICLMAFAVVATGSLATPARADEPVTISDAITRAMFNQSGDTYRNTGIDRQATLLFGLSYPDLEAVGDARSVNNIYQDLIRQRGGTPVRTPDLPSPFNSSLLSNPSYIRN